MSTNNKEEYLRRLVVERLRTIPPNVSFSIGGFGEYTRDELINQVLQGSELGKKTVELEIEMIHNAPKLIRLLGAHK